MLRLQKNNNFRFKLTSSNGIMEIYINTIGYTGLK